MFRPNNLIAIFIAIILLLLISFSAFAQQTDNGSLTGIVTDSNSQPVANATVAAKNSGNGQKRTVTTNNEGRWTINVLVPGNYDVTVEASGFQKTTKKTTVSASNTTTLDVVIGVAEVGADVTVLIGDQNSNISTEKSPVSGTSITGKALEDLPNPTRSPFGFAAGDAAVASDLTDPLTNGGGNPEISINGGRTTSIGVVKDGVDATNLTGTGSLTENISPAPETVQEVKVLTSLYDASLGRNGGGNIQLITRRGESTFAGTAYLYAQNEKFNANDFFYNRDGIDRQKARRLEGGFTLGGPIIKDKLFFFGGYQKTDAATAYVPTAQSLVVLPLALAFAQNRSPQGLRQAFQAVRGDTALGFSNPACVATSRIPSGINPFQLINFCIDPFGPGYKLFNLRNPTTGDFLIPTLTPGRFQQLFLNPVNNIYTTDTGRDIGRLAIVDFSRESGIGGGNPLVRFRNVFPAEFKQDQFTTRLDYNLFQGKVGLNTLYGTFFFANFPAKDPFTTDTLVSPFPLVKNDRNRTLAITDLHIFNEKLINEFRFGYFSLDNSRTLDERLLTSEFTNAGLGIQNPATIFAPGAVTDRCGRISGRGDLQDFQVCAPNDIFNRRNQLTLTFADNLTYTQASKTLRFGIEYKRNTFQTDLPEEQGGDFENLDNFNQLLLGYVPESDTAFGISDKTFQFNDLSFYASNDWKINSKLTVNLGVRWDWFGIPSEKNGRFANFDPKLITNPDDLRPGFILPSNAQTTGFAAIDNSLPTIARANNKNTLNGNDLNNFAPRLGFAWSPFGNEKTTIRGGYGLFYDRPSASFINTVYKNYPFFREVEERFDLGSPFALQYDRAFVNRNPSIPFSQYFPFRLQYIRNISVSSPFQLFDSTPVTTIINGESYPGARAEPLEFRAVDRDLKTPLIQQWNLGVQQELGKGWVVETRYTGTRGSKLLLAVGLNQAYDLNDPTTPDYIFERFNRAYLGINPNNTLNPGATARQRGCGLAFGAMLTGNVIVPIGGFQYPFGPTCAAFPGRFDYNFDALSNSGSEGTDLIDTDLRVPFLGLDPVESIQLQSRGYSSYHAGQLNISKRFSNGIYFTSSYSFSKSIDIGSTDPGSTAASGRPDTPSLGLVIQGDQRNLDANRAVSDFDRTHRFSASFAWQLPGYKSKSRFLGGWQLSGFGQWQSGSPFTILASDVEFVQINQSGNFQGQFVGRFNLNEVRQGNTIIRTQYNAGRASGTLYNAAFARPNVRDLALLTRRTCPDITQCYFNVRQNPNDPESALLPAYGRFGNLGRNVLRGPVQKRIDLSLQKTTKLSERVSLELKMDVFNIFNFVNFANPNSDTGDETDFGQITRTVGAPRVMQFGIKLRF